MVWHEPVPRTRTVAVGEAVPLDQALVDDLGYRSTLGWLTNSGRVGLAGIDMSGEELRAIAAQLDASIDDPVLPGAELIVHEPEHSEDSPRSEQLDFAAIGPSGAAELGSRSTAQAVEQSLGSMYLELASASSLGEVTAARIAGLDGFVIEGDLGTGSIGYALAWADGWKYQWQVQAAPGQITALTTSIAEVDERTWAAAISARDSNVDAAVESTIDALGIPDAGLGPAPELPRYVLPSPWKIEWITDIGIFTDEERAQRAARIMSQIRSQPSVETQTQAFEFNAAGDSPTGLIPNVTIGIAVFDAPFEGVVGVTEGSDPITIAGLDGHISPEALDIAPGALNTIEVGDDLVRVGITSGVLPREVMDAFAASLVVRPGGLIERFDSTDPRFRLLFDGPGDAPVTVEDALAPVTNWHASWTRPGDDVKVRMSIEQMTVEDLGVWLDIRRGQVEVDSIEFVEQDGVTAMSADTAEYALRYDSRTQLLIFVSTTSSEVSPTEILENELIEVGLDEWIPLVTPFNTTPEGR